MELDTRTRVQNLISSEVGPNQSHLVEWMLRKDSNIIDSIHNLSPTGAEIAHDCRLELQVNEMENWVLVDPQGKEWAETSSDIAIDKEEALEKLYEELEEEGEEKEIFEWWYIGHWGTFISHDLNELGVPLLVHPETDDVWWGRTQCGQALEADGTFWALLRLIDERAVI